jgi:hypothetical protein
MNSFSDRDVEVVERAGLINNSVINRVERNNTKQNVVILLSVLLFGLLIVIMSVASATLNEVKYLEAKPITNSEALCLPGYEAYTWQDIVDGANGSRYSFCISALLHLIYGTF